MIRSDRYSKRGSQQQQGPCGPSGTSKNALRERSRVESLRRAYLELQAAIPSVPPNTKLSKLDVLVLATTYISHLSGILHDDEINNDSNNNNPKFERPSTGDTNARLHQKGLIQPTKKWPMRTRLYTGVGAPDPAVYREQNMAPNTQTQKLDTFLNSGTKLFGKMSENNPNFEFEPSSEKYLNNILMTDTESQSNLNSVNRYSNNYTPNFPAPGTVPYSEFTSLLQVQGSMNPNIQEISHDEILRCHLPRSGNSPLNNYVGTWTSWNDSQ